MASEIIQFKNIKTGEVIEGEFYNSSGPLQKGVVWHRKGNAVVGQYNGENATILLKEGDFIQHEASGYYKAIAQHEMVEFERVQPEADQPAPNPEA